MASCAGRGSIAASRLVDVARRAAREHAALLLGLRLRGLGAGSAGARGARRGGRRGGNLLRGSRVFRALLRGGGGRARGGASSASTGGSAGGNGSGTGGSTAGLLGRGGTGSGTRRPGGLVRAAAHGVALLLVLADRVRLVVSTGGLSGGARVSLFPVTLLDVALLLGGLALRALAARGGVAGGTGARSTSARGNGSGSVGASGLALGSLLGTGLAGLGGLALGDRLVLGSASNGTGDPPARRQRFVRKRQEGEK